MGTGRCLGHRRIVHLRLSRHFKPTPRVPLACECLTALQQPSLPPLALSGRARAVRHLDGPRVGDGVQVDRLRADRALRPHDRRAPGAGTREYSRAPTARVRRTDRFGSIQPRQVYNKVGAADTRAKDTHTRPASADYNDDGGAEEHAAASFTLPDEIALSTFVLHLGMVWVGCSWSGYDGWVGRAISGVGCNRARAARCSGDLSRIHGFRPWPCTEYSGYSGFCGY
jgi:hypothetical protein